MNRQLIKPFVEHLRTEAARLKRHGALEAAATKEVDAEELEAFVRDLEFAALTLDEAAEESGYSAAHLSRLLSEGALRNAGKPGAPRIRRGDLPRKCRSNPKRKEKKPPTSGGPDLVGHVLDGTPLRSSDDE
jgi:hypothetical protein